MVVNDINKFSKNNVATNTNRQIITMKQIYDFKSSFSLRKHDTLRQNCHRTLREKHIYTFMLESYYTMY